MAPFRRTILPLLLLLALPLAGETRWTETTEETADKAYLTTGRLILETGIEPLWAIITDYDHMASWLIRGLDAPEGWKHPTYIQEILLYPDWPALEILYGVRIFGILDKDDLSAVFSIREEKEIRKRRLILTLTREYPLVKEGIYTIELTDAEDTETTEILFSIRTKLPALIRLLLPRKVYNSNVRYFLSHFIENLEERSRQPLNP